MWESSLRYPCYKKSLLELPMSVKGEIHSFPPIFVILKSTVSLKDCLTGNVAKLPSVSAQINPCVSQIE
jgi:hypothetical protein